DSVQQASAHAGLADVLVNMGEFAAARENFEKAISLLSTAILNGNRSGYTPMQLRGLQVYSAHRAPEALWFLGFPDQARRRSEETLVLAEKAEPLLLAHALTFTSYMHVNCREPKAVRQRVDQLSGLVNRYGLNPHYLEHANELQGRAAILEGRYTDAVRLLRDTPRAKVFVALAYA